MVRHPIHAKSFEAQIGTPLAAAIARRRRFRSHVIAQSIVARTAALAVLFSIESSQFTARYPHMLRAAGGEGFLVHARVRAWGSVDWFKASAGALRREAGLAVLLNVVLKAVGVARTG